MAGLKGTRQGAAQPAGEQGRGVGASRRRRPAGAPVTHRKMEAITQHQRLGLDRRLRRGPGLPADLEVGEVERSRRDDVRDRGGEEHLAVVARRGHREDALLLRQVGEHPADRAAQAGVGAPAEARVEPAEAHAHGQRPVAGALLRGLRYGAELDEHVEVGDRRRPAVERPAQGEVVESDVDPLVRGLPDRGRHAPAVLRRPVEDGHPGPARRAAEAVAAGAGERRRETRRRLDGDRGGRPGTLPEVAAGGIVVQTLLAEDEGAQAATGDDLRLLAVARHEDRGGDRAVRRQLEPAHRSRRCLRHSGLKARSQARRRPAKNHDQDSAQRPATQPASQ